MTKNKAKAKATNKSYKAPKMGTSSTKLKGSLGKKMKK